MQTHTHATRHACIHTMHIQEQTYMHIQRFAHNVHAHIQVQNQRRKRKLVTQSYEDTHILNRTHNIPALPPPFSPFVCCALSNRMMEQLCSDALAPMLRNRPHADVNRDRWIQGPDCQPLHHEAGQTPIILHEQPHDIGCDAILKFAKHTQPQH